MKKLLLILLCLPIIGFGQDMRKASNCDIIINQLIESTVSFIKHKNVPKKKFRFYLITQESSINWNEERFSKWQILEKKTAIQTIE